MRTISRFGSPILAFLIVAPVAVFSFLLLVPSLDPVSSQPVFHFYIVTFTSLVALIVAAFVLTGVGGIGDARSILVGMAFVGMAAVFSVHGAYTRGVIFSTSSPTVGWSARLALAIGSICILLALIDLPPRVEHWIVRSRRLLWLIFMTLYATHLLISLNFPVWLATVIQNQTVNIGLGVIVTVIFLFTSWRAWRLFQQRGGRLQLALVLALPWLAMAQVSQMVAPLWALSWWIYHLLMLAAFSICMGALALEYEQVLSFDLNRYFISLSALIALPLAVGLGEVIVRLTGVDTIRWPLVGFSLMAFTLFFGLVLLVVRHGAGILGQRTMALQEQQQWRTDFTNLLVHDLKSPLTSIRGNLDILISGLRGPVPVEQKRHLDRARQSGAELGAMIENLLDVERLESGALQMDQAPCDINALLQSSLDALREIAVLNEITLDASIPDGLPTLSVDERLIRRVIQNLLTNATKVVTAGGYIYLRASASSKQVMVAVIDNGPGVPVSERARVFEKFAQGKDAPRGGAGLGLTFCKLAIEAHGGQIWIEDNPSGGHGSAFIFTLPNNTAA